MKPVDVVSTPETRRETLRRSVGTASLSTAIIAMFFGQVMVGQFLPLIYARPMSVLALAVMHYGPQPLAVVMTAVMAATLLISIFAQRMRFVAMLLFTAYKLALAWALIPIDPWVATYLLLFAATSVTVGAIERRGTTLK